MRALALPVTALLVAFPGLAVAQVHEPALSATRDPVSQALVGIIIVAVFAFLAREKAHRVLVIFSAVAVIWLITYLTPWHLLPFDAAHRALDLNVLLLLASMMAIVGVLKTTGVFGWAVGRLLQRAGGSPLLLQAIVIWFTGILSSVLDNVTTVIFVTPMALEIVRATGIRPAAILLPMVVASNIGGTATLIGDPPNILIGSGAGLSFLQFVENLTVPVLWMMVACVAYSRWYYRDGLRAGRPAGAGGAVEVPALAEPALLRWGLAITGLVFVGFFTHSMTGMPVAVPAAIGAAGILLVQDLLYLRAHRPSMHERIHGILHVIEKEIEWPTLAFFAFLFMAVGAAVETGLIDVAAGGLAGFIGWGRTTLALTDTGTLLFAALIVCWVSAILSAFIDNIPYVAVTIPIIARLTGELAGDVEVLWWALALGSCLGGNGTPVGASANVTVMGLAERSGVHIGFREFVRFGGSTATLTLLIGSVFLAAHLFAGKTTTAAAGGAAVLAMIAFQTWRALAARRG